MDETTETGLALTLTGGVLTAIQSISAANFGLFPTFAFGLGAIIIGVGLYMNFRKNPVTAQTA
jgi:hypothetical protein